MNEFTAIALVEFKSIAAGMFAADKMVKKSPVQLIYTGSVQPGKYLVLVGGSVAEVEESHREGVEAGQPEVLDDVLLPDVHPQVVEALSGTRTFKQYDSLVVLETSSSAAVLLATDVAVKGAQVELAELRLANGLGGRGLAILSGELTDVQTAVEIATGALAGRSVKLCHSIVSNVHPQFAERVEQSSRFYAVGEDNLGV